MNCKPNLFIVGARKCGTSSMCDYLNQHPEIFMCNKMQSFFASDLRNQAQTESALRRFRASTKEEYLDAFNDSNNEKFKGEQAPIYFYSKVAAKNIRSFNPESKIIIMLRDPVEQMYSYYYQSVQTGSEPATSFEEALKLESKRKKRKKVPYWRYQSSYYYNQHAYYAPKIKRYMKHFPDNQIKVILLDDLKNNTQEVYENVLKFIGVQKTDYKVDLSPKNLGTVPRSMWLNSVLRNPGPTVRKIIKTIIPRPLRLKLIRLFNKINLSTKSRPKMSRDLRRKLMREHKSDVRKTGRLIDRDLIRIWGYEEI